MNRKVLFIVAVVLSVIFILIIIGLIIAIARRKGPKEKYACRKGKCVVDPQGPFADPQCEEQCELPPPPSLHKFVGSWLENPEDIHKFYEPGNCFNFLYANFSLDPGNAPARIDVNGWRAGGRLFIPSLNFGAPINLVNIVNGDISKIQTWADALYSFFVYDGIAFDYEPCLNFGDGCPDHDERKAQTYRDALKKLVGYIDGQTGKGKFFGEKKYLFFSFGEGLIFDGKTGAGEAIDFLRDVMYGVKNITVFYDWQRYSSKASACDNFKNFAAGPYAPLKDQSLLTFSGLQMNEYENIQELLDCAEESGLKGISFWLDKRFGDPPNQLNQKFVGDICSK